MEDLYNRALKESQKYNAKISGNSKAGNFEATALGAHFKGSYSVLDNIIRISIDKKPFFISSKMIESAVNSFIKAK
ncbi:hypothetical protein [Ferruginibacter albus]|uniref:hypothetical protein n=1 Tax=Ferruginibacter albus TaxID=2875540 RepID=UPI001CC81D7A|nr:hypothetical protein [Ferruginibacter albus]UAY52528.1 hypothetical protein K9M53_02280 [Ferruginibacter albus]